MLNSQGPCKLESVCSELCEWKEICAGAIGRMDVCFARRSDDMDSTSGNDSNGWSES